VDATHALELLALPVAAVLVAAMARLCKVAAPLALVIAGLIASEIPGVLEIRLDPEFVLFVFLPPLLFSAAWDSSYYTLRDNLRPIALLSVGLVLFSTVVVGWTAHLVVPGLPLPAAFVLGAVVAPPDAVAAVSIAQRLGLPRRTVAILVGESLFNDATALTAFRVASAAAVGEGVTLLGGIGEFLYAAVAGAAVGLLLGPALHWLRGKFDPIVETAIPLLAPFAAYLIAEAAHASGVIAVVACGMYLGHTFIHSPAKSRLLGFSLWPVVVFVLESVVFLLIGLQLVTVLDGVSARSWQSLLWYATAVFLAAVVARLAWIMAFSRAPWRGRTVVGWAGMRGVVSLAAAFAIPLATPDRDLLLFLTFTTVLATLLIHGLTFPALIRRLGIGDAKERQADLVALAGAQHAASRSALERLEELADAEDEEIVQRLRSLSERRQLRAWERLGGGTGPDGAEVPTETYRRLRLEMLAAERAAFIRLRDERRIDDELLQRALKELDLEEVMLTPH
jgi:CPA1 family monovalent cation:H+ antiporter